MKYQLDKKEMKKYFDLPYLLLITSIIFLIRELVLFVYNDFLISPLDRVVPMLFIIVFMIYVIKRNNSTLNRKNK